MQLVTISFGRAYLKYFSININLKHLLSINYVYGYARVSTQQQDLVRQLDMLKKYNCTEISTEKMSGIKAEITPSTILKKLSS